MNLSAVVRLIGINENTLRAWERRYGAVEPGRDEQGRRSYSDKEVEKLKLLWALVNEGHSIGLIAQLSVPKLRQLLSKSLSPQVTQLNATRAGPEKFLNSIIRSLETFNLEGLHQSLQRARFEMNIKEIVIDLVKPLMEQVGRLSESGKITIAQEHLLSSLLRDYLGNIHQSLSPYDFSSRKNCKAVCLTTREGDFHEFNILLAAILANVYQFRTYYLGPNMPAADLVQNCLRLKPDYLVLGFTFLPMDRELISPEKFLTYIDKQLPRSVTFYCGGVSDATLGLLSREREVIKLSGLNQLDELFASQSNL